VPEYIEQIRGTASLLVPEIVLIGTACVLFFIGPFMVSDSGEAVRGLRRRCAWLSLLGLVVAWLIWFYGGTEIEDGTLFRIDHLVWVTRGLSFSTGVLLALVMWNQIDDRYAAEGYGCLLSIIAGTSLVATANDLISMFLSLELVSIPTYVLLYLPRRDRSGGEATLKYFLLSVFSSALLLYGMSWLYGVTASTNFAAIREVLLTRPMNTADSLLPITFAFVLAGLCFRIAAVPFHFYAPDVFQGTTAANAALLSYIPKVVGFVALLRLIPFTGATANSAIFVTEGQGKLLFAVLAVITMFVGNLMALRQKNFFRLMAYSSIAHAGYMLIGLAIGIHRPVDGVQALLFYLAVYGLMTIGVFALVSAIGGGERGARDEERGLTAMSPTMLDDLRGLRRTYPSIALLMAICLFSLTGLPPTAGFFGKLNFFLASWSDNSLIGHGLAVMLALNAAISAWYYLRIVAIMFLDSAPKENAALRHDAAPHIVWAPWLAGAACSIATIVIFVAPQWLWDAVR
jgi:NADH-quinone oxidoreductase subunit N